MQNSESNAFIDQFFDSAFSVTDVDRRSEINGQSLFAFLERLHSTGDKLLKRFNCEIRDTPEFILLRLVRNQIHHLDDFSEHWISVADGGEFVPSSQHLILIRASDLAKSISDYRARENSSKKKARAEATLARLLEIWDCRVLLDQASTLQDGARLCLDGVVHDLAFDLFKPIYNITNVVADACRSIPELASKSSIQSLDDSVTAQNNIPREDLICRPGRMPILTTIGYVVATEVRLAPSEP